MFFSRHQLQEALLALDLAGTTQKCSTPRRTDKQERWNAVGEFEVGDFPPEVKDHRGRPTTAPPRPDPHGRAFLVVDPETLSIQCAACAAKDGAK
jgi:hypothetical protein